MVNIQNILEGIDDRDKFRCWLYKHCAEKKECFVPIKFGAPKKGHLYYLDAVEEAICFGWIDSVTKRDDLGRVIQRFSPRRKNSHWTYLNKQRAKRLIFLGKMTKYGLSKLPDVYEEFKIREDILKIFRKDGLFLNKLKKLPWLYVCVRLDGILAVEKKNKELFLKKLYRFIKMTKEDKMYGNWDDYGRLK